MKLKEQYYENSIVRLLKEYNDKFGTLITEAKSVDTLVKVFGMSEEDAKIFESIFKSNTIFMANKIGEFYSKLMPSTYPTVKSVLSDIDIQNEYAKREYMMIKNYIVYELSGKTKSLEKLNLEDIRILATEWEKNSGRHNYKEKEENIIPGLDFRQNGIGYYWIDLKGDYSEDECNRMSHCGRSDKGTLYSLRSYKYAPGKKYTLNDSHLTAAINGDGIVYQLKGKNNSKPKSEYHKYIIPLLQLKLDDGGYFINYFGKEYATGNDFKLTDLTDNEFLELYKERPDLYTGVNDYKKLQELGVTSRFNFDTEYYINVDYSTVHTLIKNDTKLYQQISNDYYNTKRDVYLSEVTLKTFFNKNYFEQFNDFVINSLDFTPWFEATGYIRDENKNKIIELLKILAKKENKEFVEGSINDMIESYDIREDISYAIEQATTQTMLESARDEYKDSLIETLEHYGYVNDEQRDEAIMIEGDLTNLVNVNSDTVLQVFQEFEMNSDQDGYLVADVFYELLDNKLIDLPTWSYPTIDLDRNQFNFYLRKILDIKLKSNSINENYSDRDVINILKEYNDKFGLLMESKKDVLMDKLGLKEELAVVFDEVGKKLAIWLANKYLKYYYDMGKEMANQMQYTKTAFETEPQKSNKDILEWAKTKLNQIRPSGIRQVLTSIMDYIQVGLNGNKSSLDDVSLIDIITKSKEWHDSLGIGGGSINYYDNHRILIDFRDENGEGYYWADLNVKSSDEECQRMGHCGRSSYGFLYSLRSDKKLPGGKYKLNRSHLTAAIGTDGVLYQLKGPKNSKPKEEYHKYILPLFDVLDEEREEEDYLIQGFGSEYASQQDFKISDLPDQTIRELYNNRPELFKSRSLQSKLAQMGIIEAKPFVTTFTIEFDSSDIGYYLGGDYLYSSYIFKTPAGNDAKRKVYYYETIMSDDVWDMYQGDGGRWEDNLYYVDSHNESKIREMINETDENISLKEMIEQYDDTDEIKNAINYAMSDIERDEYTQYLRDSLETALNELGNVFEFNSEKIKMQIDLKDLFSDNDIDDYFETYEDCNDNPECLFNTLLDEGSIDKPIPRFYDWSQNINKESYNDRLTDRLNEI